ncbi:MAG: hypothetical protein IJE22_08655 [Oscillibacter sp.]|nr:hypothetical protein [Oscillibacter sp.]
MKFAANAQCAPPEALDFFGPMYLEMLEKFSAGQALLVCPAPEKHCKPGDFLGWVALNAMAYGYRQGKVKNKEASE